MSEPSTLPTLTLVREVLRPRLGEPVTTMDPDLDLAEAFGDAYDSLTAMECVTAIETHFGIEVDFVAHDVRHWFATLGRIARFVTDALEDQARLGSTR
ncbi:acyl carrier protein [Streptomyces sp. NPDC049879]|uniref:acyl carrier protein n=1 Tax=Streptomyces sp. NPDC049879 TaxID=3365598 RepID=UPI0037984E3C